MPEADRQERAGPGTNVDPAAVDPGTLLRSRSYRALLGVRGGDRRCGVDRQLGAFWNCCI